MCRPKYLTTLPRVLIFYVSLAIWTFIKFPSQKAGYNENLQLQPAKVLQKVLAHLRVSVRKKQSISILIILMIKLHAILPIFIISSVNYD